MKSRQGKIKILYLINGFQWGGAESKVAELIEHINRELFQITVVVLDKDGPLKERLKKSSSKLYAFPRKYGYPLYMVFILWHLMRKERIDIVQTTLFYADVLGSIAARLAGVKFTISWITVSSPPGSPDGQLKHRLAYRFAAKFMKKIVVVSNAIGSFMMSDRKINADKIQTIYYGIDLNNGQKQSRYVKNELFPNSRNLIFIGVVARLHKQKGHRYLIDAAPKIIEKFRNVLFLMVGDGPEKKVLKKQVYDLKLTSYFKFLGFRRDIPCILKTIDIFVLPSLYEGFPNVILEAMAYRKPVIASAVDGNTEAVLNGKTGYLVPPGETDHLAKKTIELLANEIKRHKMGAKGYQRIKKFFSLENQINAFEKLYFDCFDNH